MIWWDIAHTYIDTYSFSVNDMLINISHIFFIFGICTHCEEQKTLFQKIVWPWDDTDRKTWPWTFGNGYIILHSILVCYGIRHDLILKFYSYWFHLNLISPALHKTEVWSGLIQHSNILVFFYAIVLWHCSLLKHFMTLFTSKNWLS